MEHEDDEADVGGGTSSSFSIVCRRQGTTGEVVVSGELDLVGGDAVEAAAAELVASGVTAVSIQAEDLTFIDSSGIGGLLAARAAVVEVGGTFRFGPMTDAVARVIEVAGVSDLLGPNPRVG